MERSRVWDFTVRDFGALPIGLVGEILRGLFRFPFSESFCAFVTCPTIIALMLALAVRLTAEALKGNCLLAPRISSNWKFDRMYAPLQFYTKGRAKPDSPYTANETSQQKAKLQLWKCKHFWILLHCPLNYGPQHFLLHIFRFKCTHLQHEFTKSLFLFETFMYSKYNTMHFLFHNSWT